jgi:hypothetical protein
MEFTDFLLVDSWPPFFQGRNFWCICHLVCDRDLGGGITNQGTILLQSTNSITFSNRAFNHIEPPVAWSPLTEVKNSFTLENRQLPVKAINKRINALFLFWSGQLSAGKLSSIIYSLLDINILYNILGRNQFRSTLFCLAFTTRENLWTYNFHAIFTRNINSLTSTAYCSR